MESKRQGGLEISKSAQYVLNVCDGTLAVSNGSGNFGKRLSNKLDAILDSRDALLFDVVNSHVQVIVDLSDIRGALLQVRVLVVLKETLDKTFENVKGNLKIKRGGGGVKGQDTAGKVFDENKA